MLAAGGYFVVGDQAQVSVPTQSELEVASTTTSPTQTSVTAEKPEAPETKVEEPKSPPPARQTFDAVVHEVKYFYDTVQVPVEGYVRSGYKNEVRIRGKLIAIKPEGLCKTAPCPIPSASEYRYVIENAQDYVQNSKYHISIRKTGDPVAMSLKEGQVYVFTGTLEHSFNTADQVAFVFDPKSAE